MREKDVMRQGVSMGTHLGVLLSRLDKQTVLHDPHGREELEGSGEEDGERVEELSEGETSKSERRSGRAGREEQGRETGRKGAGRGEGIGLPERHERRCGPEGGWR